MALGATEVISQLAPGSSGPSSRRKGLVRSQERWPQPPLSPSQESLGSLSYSNSIRGHVRGHPGRVIVRHRAPQLKVTCRVDGRSAIEVAPGADSSARQRAGYDVSVSFLELPTAPPAGSGRPSYAGQRNEVFLQATLRSPNPNLRLLVDTCVASPDPQDFTTVTYDLIRQG